MSFKNTMAKVGFTFRAHSPEILLGTGIVGMIAGTVIACIITSKVPEKVEKLKEGTKAVNEAVPVTDEDSKKENQKLIVKEYAKFGLEIAKIYAPVVIIEACSIVSMISSNRILKKRSAIAMAAYVGLKEAYKKYRERVAEKYGEDTERELYYGITKEKVTEEITDENGKKKKNTVEKSVVPEELKDHSAFAVIFDEFNPNWEKDAIGRKFFLTSVQNYCNDKLKANGYLFLNEVYEELGFPKTKAGQIFGWLYRPDDPDYKGDGFVDFGIFDVFKKLNRDFVNGYEPGIILDFNVDGDIVNLTGTTKDAKMYVSKYSY